MFDFLVDVSPNRMKYCAKPILKTLTIASQGFSSPHMLSNPKHIPHNLLGILPLTSRLPTKVHVETLIGNNQGLQFHLPN